MTTQQFLKGLMMALVAVVVAAFNVTPIDWILLAVTAACTVLTYSGKNLITWLHSDSPVGSLSIINIVSGVLVAIGTGVLEGVSLFLINGAIEWGILLKVVLSVTFTYLGSTVFAPEHNTTKVKFLIR